MLAVAIISPKPINAEELLAQMKQVFDTLHPEQRRPSSFDNITPIVSQLPIDDPEFAEIVVDFIDALLENRKTSKSSSCSRCVKTSQIAHWMKGLAERRVSMSNCSIDSTDPSCQIPDWDQVDYQLATIDELLDRIMKAVSRTTNQSIMQAITSPATNGLSLHDERATCGTVVESVNFLARLGPSPTLISRTNDYSLLMMKI